MEKTKKRISIFLVVTLLALGFGMYAITSYAQGPDEYSWDFNTDGDFEGWTGYMQMENRNVSGGYYNMTAIGAAPSKTSAIFSPAGFSAPAAEYSIFTIKLKNSTASTNIDIYFANDTGGFAEARKSKLPIVANIDTYEEYTFDLSTNSNWNGIFSQFMLAFGNVTGDISIDYVKLSKPTNEPKVYEWNFDDNTTMGWSAWGHHSVSAQDGAMKAARSDAEGHGAVNSPDLSLSTDTYKYLVIGVNSTDTNKVKFYFRNQTSLYNETDTLYINIEKGTTFKEYVYDLSSHGGWTGDFKSFMVQLDPQTEVVFDYIKLCEEVESQPQIFGWDFDDNTTMGWTAWGHHSVTAQNGAIKAVRSDASGNGAIDSPAANISTQTYKYLVVGVNSASAERAKFYFRNQTSSYNETDTFYINLEQGTTFKEYVYELSEHSGWTGDFKSFMVQLNTQSSEVVFDYIYFTNKYIPPAEPEMYDLTFYPYGADGSSDVVNVEEGTVYQDFNAFVPEREGFTFVEWVDILGEAIVFPYTVSDNDAIYGTWQEDVVAPDPIFGNIAFQTTATSVSDDFTSLRLLIGIDSLDYLSAGFKLSGNDNFVYLTTKSVYESFGGFDASAFGGNYIVVVEIHNIPNAAFGSPLTIEAFVKGFDNEFIYATAQNIIVADAILAE